MRRKREFTMDNPLQSTQNPVKNLPLRNTLLIAAALLVGDATLRVVHAAPDPEPPKTLVAQEFQLVDKTGTIRGVFGLQSDGATKSRACVR